MKEAPKLNEETSDFEEQVKGYDELRNSLKPGFAPAGPRFAAPQEPLARGKLETVAASLGEGVTASIFGGFQTDRNLLVDPNYDVATDLRPGDERYAAQLALMPNSQETHRFQADMDARDERLGIITARPYLGFFGQLLDPLQLTLDVSTYGLGHAVTIPLLANTARRSHTAINALKAAKLSPRQLNAATEAIVGAQAGASSVYATQKIKSATNEFETDEDLGQHVFIASLLGMALGGSVGLLGKKGTTKIVDEFSEANQLGQKAAAPPPPSPKKFDIRAQENPRVRLTPEEIKIEAKRLRESVDTQIPQRKLAYETLRAQFTQIGENLTQGLPGWAQKAVSLVTWPIRNLSATNRLLNSPLGTARLYAMGMARNATEFIGTREGLVLPRSAQNRIEDIANHSVDVSLDLYKYFLEANKISEGALASERLRLSGKIYAETDFYEDISTQLLHVGKESESFTGANPVVQRAAKHAYEQFYKPYGELLKDYGLIKPTDDVAEVLNYLNRNWKTSKILQSPEEFKLWLSEYFDKQNEKLKSLMPAYEQGLKNAKQLARDAKRFDKAASILEAIERKLEKQKAKGKIKKETSNRYEYLKKKYSRKGLEAFYRRKAAERFNPELASEARKIEAKEIQSAEPINEARMIAAELRQGAEFETKRAEDIIPRDLRSNKTGKPRKIYDSEIDPTYSYSQAERVLYTLIGQEDEIVINPVLAALGGNGTPGILKARNIHMPDNYPGIENWVERDIRVLMNNFSGGISPPIALTELMHQLNEMPIVRQTVRRMQVSDKSIGPEKALELPDLMTNYNEVPGVMATMMREEFKLQSEGLSGKELEKLVSQYQAAEKEIVTLDKEIKGVMANGFNVNSKGAADFIDLFNSAVSTVTTNNIVISMLSDLMGPSLRYGFGDYISKVIKPLLSSPELRNIHAKEAKAMHIALKTAQGAITKNRISGRDSSMKNSTAGRFFSNLSNRMGNITGANGMQDMMEIASTVLIKTNLLVMAEKATLKNISKKELTHLAQRSLSPEDAKIIHDLWKKYGFEKDGTRGIDPDALENMSPSDAKAYTKYNNYVNDELKTIIVKPGVGSLPDYSYTPFGKALFYLKKYFFAATNDLLIPAAQRFDKESAQGFVGLFAIGALQSEIRRIYRAEERKEFNLETFVAEALTNSALLGIYSFNIDLGIASGIIQGSGGARYDPSGGVASLIAGPGVIGYSGRTLGILGKMRKIMTDEDKQFTYKEWNAMANTYVPLYKWAPISAVVKPNIKAYFEEQGRGGD